MKRIAPLLMLLQALHRVMLRTFPPEFRAAFGEEMTEIFDERLAVAQEQGARAMAVLCGRELGQWPAALLRLHFYRWRKKRRRVMQFITQISRESIFGIPPAADDGRFSPKHLLLEIIPFLYAASLILLLTYWPPIHRDPLSAAAIWAGVLPLLVILLGLAQGMPRWAYPHGGLLAGYTMWLAIDQRLVWLWVLLSITAVSLAVMAVVVNRGERPLPAFFQRIGASIALDWTRLSFGVFGAAPLLILAAFDNAFLNQRTPYLALALLVMVLTAWLYGRCRRQDRQLAALLGGSTLLFISALLDNVYWQGWTGDFGWLAALWIWMVTLLLLPLFSVPVQFTSPILPAERGGKE
jgi:hypothetical protein